MLSRFPVMESWNGLNFGGACGDWEPSCIYRRVAIKIYSVCICMHGTEDGSTTMIPLTFHLMDMKIVGQLARHWRGVS